MASCRKFGARCGGWLVILAALCSSGWAIAQPSGVNVFVPADRTLRQHLARAAKAIAEERFSDAVSELGVVLANPSPGEASATRVEAQDFFLDAAAASASRTSLKTEALRMLGKLPPRGRESYELQFGAAARALLDAAISERNLEKLHEVVRKYLHTRAGNEAALLLGRLYLDGGQPLAAALYLKQLAEFPASAAYEPELSVLLAACWYRAHQPEAARATLHSLRERFPAARLQIGESESEVPPSEREALAWLERNFGSLAGGAEQLAQWTLFRGNESRNAASRGGVPLENFRWQVPVAGYEEDRKLVQEMQQSFIEQGLPLLPGLQPLAVDNVILMRTQDFLMAVDFETGKRVWNWPWWDGPQSDTAASGSLPASERESRKASMAQRLWQNALWGQVSSDGENVYLLDSLPAVTMTAPNFRRLGMRAAGLPFPGGELQNANNELVALELKREGALKWKIGRETGLEEPQTAGLFFLGPPLPLFGKLFAIAEIRGEVRLIVLDSATGRQEWSQQLAHLESFWQFDSSAHRLAGASPSYADGVLVCPTASGAVVGVDVAGRRLLWGYQYQQAFPQPNGFGMMPYSPAGPYSTNRWLDATATIADGRVVLTPPESDLLICLDLLTGQPAWKPLSRQGDLADMLFVACVHEGKIVLVGKSRVMALNLSDGQPSWAQPLVLDVEKGEMPSGRGFLTGDQYYLPTTTSQLISFRVRDGSVAQRVKTGQLLGNLICFKDHVISLGPNFATAAYQLEPLRKQVAQRLAKDPGDGWALARQGELQVHDGQWSEALASLTEANRLQPKDEGVRALLVSTFLTALRQDFAQHRQSAPRIEPLILGESQRIDYWLMLGAGCESIQDARGAVEAYIQLARQAFSASSAEGSFAFPVVTPAEDWSVRLDRFLQARLAEHYRTGDASVREAVDRLVEALRSEASRAPDGSLSGRLLAICGFHPGAQATWLEHAGRLMDAGKLVEAEMALAAINVPPDSVEAARAALLSARIDAHLKDAPQVNAAYAAVRDRWPDTVVSDGQTGKELYAAAVARGLVAPLKDPWPLTRTQFREQSLKGSAPFRRLTSIPVWQQSGRQQRGLRLVFDFLNSTLYVRDGRGEVLARMPQSVGSFAIQSGTLRAVADGHVLFANLNGNMMAVPLLRSRSRDEEAVLWHEPLIPLPTETGGGTHVIQRTTLIPFDAHKTDTIIANASNRPLAVSGPMNRAGVCYQKVRTLTCADPLTGTPVWMRQDLDQGLELFGDEQFVVAASRQQAEATLLDARDGRTLGKRTLPPSDHTWTQCGRNVLAWEKKEGQWRLFVVDVAEQRDLWSELVAEGSKGCLVENDAVAILQPDGRFFLRSLLTDTCFVRSTLPVIAELDSVRVRASQEQWLVIVNDKTSPPAGVVQANVSGPQLLTPVNGQIFAFAREGGGSLWQSPAIVRGYSILVEQPDEVPTLWLVRQRGPGQRGPGQIGAAQIMANQSNRVDVLCLDRRTGAALVRRSDVASVATSQLQVTADAARREVTLHLAQNLLTLQFTDEPRPPEPPLQLAYRVGSGLGAALLEELSDIVTSVTDSLKGTEPTAADRKPR